MFGQQNNNQQQGTGFGGFGTNNNTGSGMSSTCLFLLTHSLDTVMVSCLLPMRLDSSRADMFAFTYYRFRSGPEHWLW